MGEKEDGIDYNPREWDIDGTTVNEYLGSKSKVMVPEGVTDIEEGAFDGCENLESVRIPSSVTGIWSWAFAHCSNLETVFYAGTLAQWCEVEQEGLQEESIKSVILIGENNLDMKKQTTVEIPNGVSRIGSCVFFDYTGLESVTIPSSVTEIGFYAFKGCTSLTNVTIPEGVAEIKEKAFEGCTNLANVTIPASVTSIECDAFYECKSLKSVTYGGTKEQWEQINNKYTGISSVVIHCADGDVVLE